MSVQAAVEDSTIQPPASSLSESDLAFVERLVSQRIGVQLEGKGYLIEGRLKTLLREQNETDMQSFVSRLRRADVDAENAIVDAMTTNETSFFRDRHPFDTLVTHVIPAILAKCPGTRGITVWNAACSSGQESLSVAMQILEHFPQLAQDSVIFSTDVSAAMVERTKAAEYTRFEVNRGLSTTLAMKYFSQVGRSWKANQELTRMIEVREMNLLGDWKHVPRCDLVMIRNVLIYFDQPTKRQILQKIRTNVLKPHGGVMLGTSESTRGIDDALIPTKTGESTLFYSKER